MLKLRSFFWINGLFFILFGMLLFFQPSLSLKIIIIITSIEIMISGIIGLIVARTTTEYNHRRILFVISIITFIFGFLLLCIPQIGEFIASFAVILIGLGAIIKGGFLFIDGLKARESGISNRWMFLAIGIIAILFGIFLICNAFLTVLVINVLLGFAMIFIGILLFIRGFQAKEKSIEGLNGIEGIEDYDDIDE